MTATLSFIEIINAKKATERAVAKLLTDLQKETGVEVTDLFLIRAIGNQEIIKVQIETKFENG